jgi:hypothetical protein
MTQGKLSNQNTAAGSSQCTVALSVMPTERRRLAEDEAGRVDEDTAIIELEVGVVGHGRAVAAAVQTCVSADDGASAYGRSQSDGGLGVEDQHGKACVTLVYWVT